MQRIAILVDQEFTRHHVGVRNYLHSLAKVLAQTASVEFVASKLTAGKRHFYRLLPKQEIITGRERASAQFCISGSPNKMLREYRLSTHKIVGFESSAFHYSSIGDNIAGEGYDLVVIGYPWLVDFAERLGSKQAGIVYDTVPNEYTFSQSSKPFDFAAQHVRGFKYYDQSCDFVFAISKAAAASYNRFFAREKPAVGLPPLCPASYHTPPKLVESDRRSVVLASPFDRRKGLHELPTTLNALKGEIDDLNIYGKLRCTKREAAQFFKALELDSVNWWPDAPTSVVHEILGKAKCLLFPSLQEGLGLPILEAQMCGTPALVRDAAPMKDLLVDGSMTFQADKSDASWEARELLRQKTDPKLIQRCAYESFSPANVAELFWNTLESNGQASRPTLLTA